MPEPPRKLLVTGAGGFVGGHLFVRLAGDPAVSVVALPRRLQSLDAAVWSELGVAALDCVFHLGAFTPKQAGEEGAADVAAVWESNLDGTRALLQCLPPTRRLVYASTLDVYGAGRQPGPITEQTPVAPATLYAASKLFCESLVTWYGRVHGVEVVILRYGHLFGPGEDAYDKLIPRTIRRLLSGRPPGIHGEGTATRDLLYVGDAVEATVRAANSPLAAGRVINVVRGESVQIREVIETLIELTGYIGPVRHYPDGPGARSISFDNALMRALLGEWPLTSVGDGLRDEVALAALQQLGTVAQAR